MFQGIESKTTAMFKKQNSQKYFIIFTGLCTTLVKQQRIFILSFVCVLQYAGCYISYLIKYFKLQRIKFHNKQELLHSQKRRVSTLQKDLKINSHFLINQSINQSINRVCTSRNFFRLGSAFLEGEMTKPSLKKLREVQT